MPESQGASSKRKAKKGKAQTLFSGSSPAGATRWQADSPSTIYTDIDLSYLNFDRAPKYFCTVTTGGRAAFPGYENAKDPLVFSSEAAQLINVTGKYLPRRATAKGFRVRLKYKPEDGRNLTTFAAKGWRVKWIAITNDHPVMQDLHDQLGEINPAYTSAVAYLKMMQKLVQEDIGFVAAAIGREYQLPLSQIPKPKPKPKVKVEKENDTADEKAEAEKKEEAKESTGDGQTEVEEDSNVEAEA